MKVDLYLNYKDNCEQAFRFYEQQLGAKVIMLSRHGDQPGGGSPPGLTGLVLHAQIELGGAVIMGADVGERHQPMRSAYLSLSVDTSAEAERLYALLTEGGEVFMKMEDTFFAKRFAMFRDRFGTSWMLLGEQRRA